MGTSDLVFCRHKAGIPLIPKNRSVICLVRVCPRFPGRRCGTVQKGGPDENLTARLLSSGRFGEMIADGKLSLNESCELSACSAVLDSVSSATFCSKASSFSATSSLENRTPWLDIEDSGSLLVLTCWTTLGEAECCKAEGWAICHLWIQRFLYSIIPSQRIRLN